MDGFQWTIGIHDPTWLGWLTVLAYALTAYLCLRAFRVEKAGPARPDWETIPAAFRVLRKHWPDPPPRARRAVIWALLALGFVLLAINKQLDFQTLLTDLGRLVVTLAGWYELRQAVHAFFILTAVIAAGSAFAFFVFVARGQLAAMQLPVAGLTLVVLYVLLRAALFHRIEELLEMPLGGLSSMGWLIEITGIALVATGAVLRIRSGSRG